MPRTRGDTPREGEQVSAPHLPDEVVEQILYGLPLKSIARFMSISKQWNSLLTNPHFVDSYKTHPGRSANNQLIFAQSNWNNKSNNSISIVEFADLTTAHEEAETWPVSPLANCPKEIKEGVGYGGTILGSYNGLVAIACYDSVILWNPLTGKYSRVSTCLSYGSHHLYGLCYDASSDTYIAVLGTNYNSSPTSPTSRFDYFLKFETIAPSVVNFKTGAFKPLYNSLERRRLISDGIGTIVCGVPHWFVRFIDFEQPLLGEEILYFDFEEEKFKQLAQPCSGENKRILGLGSMMGQCQVGVVVQERLENGFCFEVWVMKEYGKSESWANLFVIEPNPVNRTLKEFVLQLDLLGYTKNGELLIDVNRGELWAYDLGEGSFRRILLSCKRKGFMFVNEPSRVSPPQLELQSEYAYEELEWSADEKI